MFSNDRNIESIGQLVEIVKHYIGLQKEYAKLDVVDKIVRLLTAVTIISVISLLLMLCLIYLSFAVAYALEPDVGDVMAFVIIAGFYFLLLILCVLFRHQWIERPLVHFLANILLDANDSDNIG